MKKFLCSVALLCISFVSFSQVISTIAGTGTSGYSGDGGPATSAQIGEVRDVVKDNSGNIYFCDKQNNVVRKINTSGVITTIAGTGAVGYSGDGGPATAAHMYYPYGLAFDASNNLYVVEQYNHVVRKINATTGIITTVAGNGSGGYSGDGGPATSAQIFYPLYICFDNSGNMYISDNQNHRIRKVSTSGIISTVAGNGTLGYTGDGGPATSATLSYTGNVRVDASGNLYIADGLNNVVRKVNTSGIITTVAGTGTAGYSGDGGLATAATLNLAHSIAFDNTGNMYICDYYNNRIRKVDASTGIISTFCGTGVGGYNGDGIAASTAQLNEPPGIWIDASNTVYICDLLNYRIRKVTADIPPTFVDGATDTLTLCEDAEYTPINNLLKVNESVAGETITWSLSLAPTHGAASVAYTTTSTGSTLTPTGLTYTPDPGYSGPDMFKVTVSNGISTSEIEIYVNVVGLPYAGVISGTDSVCPGDTVLLSETVSGGIWSNSNVFVSIMDFSGQAIGVAPGTDTVIYTVINACGIVSAIFPFTVRDNCPPPTGVQNEVAVAATALNIFPNPANEVLHIQYENGLRNIAIFDATGRMLISNKVAGKNTDVDVAPFAPGIYFVRINDKIMQKFIKE